MRDPAKAKARLDRYRQRKHAERFGPNAGDMRGRHGNHARGSANGKWNEGRMISSEGYVLIRVGPDHPLAFGTGYAYEHHVVWCAAGRPAPTNLQVIHHKNEDKTDNRIGNLELKTRSDHAAHHCSVRGRDDLGRFPPKEQA